MAYSQNDSRWAGKILGLNTDRTATIGALGCLVTATANFMSINGDNTTPDTLNNVLKAMTGGFVPRTGILYWSAIPKLNPAIIATGEAVTLTDVNNWLADAPNFALMEVKNHAGGQHFVLGNLVNTIIDSADGNQKNMLTYPFVHAHLYRWTQPGKGAIAAPITNPQEGKVYVEPAVLTDLQNWKTAATAPGAVIVQQAVLDDLTTWKATGLQLQAEVTILQSQLAAATAPKVEVQPVAATIVPALPAGITSETPHQVTRVANEPGEMVDYGSEGLPTLPVTTGMVFKQASTFVANGVSYVRTQKSKDNNQWYGTPESLFDPVAAPSASLSAGDTAALKLSKLFGAIGKWVYNWPIFKHK